MNAFNLTSIILYIVGSYFDYASPVEHEGNDLLRGKDGKLDKPKFIRYAAVGLAIGVAIIVGFHFAFDGYNYGGAFLFAFAARRFLVAYQNHNHEKRRAGRRAQQG